MAELLLDSNIRGWVFLPIIVITFLMGVVRHYISLILFSPKGGELTSIQDFQVTLRSKALRENGKYLVDSSFLMRKHYFNDEDTGYYKTKQRPPVNNNPMFNPDMMTDMVKGNVSNVIPMILFGGWINWMLSGFVTTKLPFPLTLRFQPMLQRGIELYSLDASWVSSVSWYFLNVFGLRSLYALALGNDNAANDQFPLRMGGEDVPTQFDPKLVFKGEWEALELCRHKWALADIASTMIAPTQPTSLSQP